MIELIVSILISLNIDCNTINSDSVIESSLNTTSNIVFVPDVDPK